QDRWDRSAAYEARERPVEALAAGVRLTTVDPKDSDGWARRARLAKTVGEGREALAAITRAVALAPDRADFVRSRRDLLTAQGAHKAAVEAGEQLLRFDPKDDDALRGRPTRWRNSANRTVRS